MALFLSYILEYVTGIYAKRRKGKGNLGAYAMKRVAAGAHLPTLWLFEPAKRQDNRADYCLGCSSLL